MGKDGQEESVRSFRMNPLAGRVRVNNCDSKQFPASISAITRLFS